MEHGNNPPNAGVIAGNDEIGQLGNPVCEDRMMFAVRVKDHQREDEQFTLTVQLITARASRKKGNP
jgi:NifU-like protein involved in Fe-S cluster formation